MTKENNIYELQIEDAELSLEDIIQADNIAELLSKRQLQEIASNCTTKMDIDDGSRSDWLDVLDAVNDIMKIDFKERTFPWRGASNAKYPMIVDAVIKVSSRLYTDIVKGDKICKSRIVGPDLTGDKAHRADRIDTHMNWQIIGDSESDWDENTDDLFQKLITYGTVFRKISHNPATGKRLFETIDPGDCIVNNSNSHLDHDTIISQRHIFTSNDIESRIRTKTFIDYDYLTASTDEEAIEVDGDGGLQEYEYIEQHTLLDLDDDGYAEPYIVYVDTQANMAVRIVKNFNPNDIVYNEDDEVVMIAKIDHYVVYRTGFNLDGSFYHYGLGSLLYNINDSINKLLRQQIDVASLQARQGMIFSKGARVRGGNRTVRLNENIIIDTAPGEKLRDNVMEYPVNPPSPIVLQLFELLLTVGSKISGLTDVTNLDSGNINNIPATTMLAMIEQGLKNYSALYKRVYRSLTKEFSILYRLNREYTDEAEYINVLDDVQAIYQVDYEDENIDIVPNADPTVSSDTQRIMRLQALLEIKDDPQVNDRAILEDYIKILGQDVPKMLPPPDPNPPPPPEIIQMQNNMQVAAVQLDQESRRLDQKDIELQMESQKIAADIQLKETEALLKIAQAESEERGRQLEEYKAILEGFKQMIEVTPTLGDISAQTASMDVTEAIPIEDVEPGDEELPEV